MAKVITVRCKVTSITSSRQQYKPYGYVFEPVGMFVDLTLPNEDVIESKDGEIVLTMDGFSATLGRIADSLDAMHKQYEYKQTGRR